VPNTRWIEDNKPSVKFPLWTRANIGEVLPEPPSPLGWDLVWETGTLLGWRDCGVNRLGTPPEEVSEIRPEVSGLFGGYGFLNASAFRVFGERAPGMTAQEIDEAYFGDHPDVPPFVPEDWHVSPSATEGIVQWMTWVMTTPDQPELEADRVAAEACRADRPDLTEMSNTELLDLSHALTPTVRTMFEQHINQSAAAPIGSGVIGAVAAAVGDPSLTLKIIGGLGDVDSAAPSFVMWDMSRTVRASVGLVAVFDEGPRGLTAKLRKIEASDDPSFGEVNTDVVGFMAQLQSFIERFGSRGPNEWDIHAHTWETDPDLILAAIDRMRLAPDEDAPSKRLSVREAERKTVVAGVAEAIAGDPEAHGQFLAAVHSASLFLPGRERSKTSIIKVIHEIRMAAWELGARLVAKGGCDEARDICLLFADEIERGLDDPEWAAATVSDRKEHLDHLQQLEPPFLFEGEMPPIETWARRADLTAEAALSGEVIQAVAGSSGVYRGTARVVLDPSDPTVLGPGEILVAPHTDPAWTPLFVAAGAVVVDVGAALSHAVIVSRELGLPCVVSATSATKRIADGTEIEVNGDLGTVTLV